jgi:nitrogenase molybdenum-iron protein beta chain
METGIDRPRNSCALHGALHALTAIPGVVPIVHSTAGCAAQYAHGAGDRREISATNILERHVIFGGASRLREQLKNTLQMREGELYVVLTGCPTEVIGDDSGAMTREAAEGGAAALYISAAGFRSPAQTGYVRVIDAISAFYSQPSPPSPEPGMVNILGVLPGLHPFWLGELQAIKEYFALLGLRANTLFGPDARLSNWREIPSAGCNIVLSQWGLSSAENFRDRYGTPFINAYMPIGPDDSEGLARRLREETNLPLRVDSGTLETLKNYFYHCLEAAAPAYYDHGLQRNFSFVGPHDRALGTIRFMEGTLGFEPDSIVITDAGEKQLSSSFLGELRFFLKESDAALFFEEDAGEIARIIADRAPSLLIASAIERAAAEKLDIQLLELSSPLGGLPVFSRHHFGPWGGLNLSEEIFRLLLADRGRR